MQISANMALLKKSLSRMCRAGAIIMCVFGDLPLCKGNACSSMRVRARVKKEDKSTYHMRIEQRSPSQYLKGFFSSSFLFGISFRTSMVLIVCRSRLFQSQRTILPLPDLADLELYGRILFRILFVICPYIDTQLSYSICDFRTPDNRF